jgi:hypothetical protein
MDLLEIGLGVMDWIGLAQDMYRWSSCERGNEPSGSIKAGKPPSGCTTCGLSSGTQLHRVSYAFMSKTKDKMLTYYILKFLGIFH